VEGMKGGCDRSGQPHPSGCKKLLRKLLQKEDWRFARMARGLS
jgi:hypothetical protein